MAGPATNASDHEARIDALYALPLSEFTAARNALAKSLTGAAAEQVKRLAKPAPVPWIVNQVYWRARSVYDRLIESGAALRRAQIAAIEKPATSDRASAKQRQQRQDAAAAHEKAVASAVHQGIRLATAAKLNPPVDVLTRFFEALSLAPEHPGPRGRLTQVIEPTGFGVFAGVVSPAAAAVREPSDDASGSTRRSGSPDRKASSSAVGSHLPASTPAADPERARREEAARAERRQRAARALDDARRIEARLREALAGADQAKREAETELARLNELIDQSQTALHAAMLAREAAERTLAQIDQP